MTINGSAKLWIHVDESNLFEDIGKEGVEAMGRVTKMIRQMTWAMGFGLGRYSSPKISDSIDNFI